MTLHSTIEEELRNRLDRATTDVLGAPDLHATLVGGRRRRAGRRRAAVASGVTGVAVVAMVGVVGTGALHPPATSTPAAAGVASSATDWVPGTTVDETLAQVVADHVARPGRATGIYASDWTRSTPLPDTEASRATEWQAHYRVAGDDTLTVLMSQRPTDAPAGPPVCDPSVRVVDGTGTRLRTGDIAPDGSVTLTPGRSAEGATSCVVTRKDGGTLVLSHDGLRTTATFWRTADATVVTATAHRGSGTETTAHGVTDAELAGVATDPRLVFAHVADPPAWPAANGPGWPSGL
ncbi:hypothetical protein [Terracoccus sp. 273MFTsu3.1]|uniref:hypothetical protein n=1 Tax=Terracoccus sp. 273MFTsu3.1 TaxID=1172188 RepID=UPI000361B4AA|nr:hypothetical protein [Terracoccus sp. 273MFTsu3.1]